MFEASDKPRVFALPPGVDFPKAFVEGLLARSDLSQPEKLARTKIYVNTRRMHRRMVALFESGPARLLPHIRVIDEIGSDLALHEGLAPPAAGTVQRMRLWRLVRALIASEPGIAPEGSAFGLADTLGALLDEMQGEGVDPDALEALDLDDHAAHWQTNLRFLRLIRDYLAAEDGQTSSGRLRWAADHLQTLWAASPPTGPILIAGSTGSRGATALIMDLVARLDQGAVVLPGFDAELPDAIWQGDGTHRLSEDHPQFRFGAFMDRLNIGPGDVAAWHGSSSPTHRNKLVSLALRPASVTGQWLREGPELGDLTRATDGMTLLEAETPRDEANAIAFRLRRAVEDGVSAAVITPDRTLGRRISAALDRWGILPDDSAGRPFALSPPGRLLLQATEFLANSSALETVLAFLKHPLVHAEADRNAHLIRTRELELWLRRKRCVSVSAETVLDWSKDRAAPADADWAEWVASLLAVDPPTDPRPFSEVLDAHIALTVRASVGPTGASPTALWAEAAGQTASRIVDDLRNAAEAAGIVTNSEYRDIIQGIFAVETVRDPFAPNPNVAIWGTLEARAGGADLIILAGLNEGIWPDQAGADPWLNRAMRASVGLLSPERRIGLQAHDFQQAIAAPEVVITRSLRDAEAETVPSRWLNRLTNLLEGLPQTRGPEALRAMRQRGRAWLDLAAAYGSQFDPIAKENRPAPRPPVAARPNRLSVTKIERLVRDPYAIYAEYVLGLKPLDPMRPRPDATLKGSVFHAALEAFSLNLEGVADTDFPDCLRRSLSSALSDFVPWPAIRAIWAAEFDPKVAELAANEADRRAKGTLLGTELRGQMMFPEIAFTLVGKADRIDRLLTGNHLEIFDYKTKAPSAKQVRLFDRQLLLEAVMAEAGAFDDISVGRVARVTYLGFGSTLKPAPIPIDDPDTPEFAPDSVRAHFVQLIRSFQSRSQGYAARRAVAELSYDYGFDHLARYGEWSDADPPKGEDVG